MKKLEIEFIDNYYSFKKGEKLSFAGDFIILSGLNGSGKSQLLNAMAKPKSYSPQYNPSKKYITIIKQDNEIIDNIKIRLLDFHENLKYGEKIKNLNANYNDRKLRNIFHFYNEIARLNSPDVPHDYSFDLNELRNAPYLHNNNDVNQASIDCWWERQKLIELIKNKFPRKNWYNLTINQIKEILPIDFEWTFDGEKHLLTHIAHVFLAYVKKIDKVKKECVYHVDEHLNSKQFDDNKWKKNAPWTRLNDLFEKINFKYRFPKDYHLNLDDCSLNEQIILKDKNNDENRDLSDLSDGEKTLLDLALNSFDFNEQNVKLILFDEYDAFLNSSMIDKVKIVLDEFYKNVQIVFVTHILTTMYQLKDESKKFYELFIKDDHHDVIDISNLVSFSDIKHFLKLLKLDDRLEFGKCKLCIVSEGKDNKKHIDHVLKNIYDIKNKNDILVWNGGGKTDFFIHYDIYKRFGKKIMFVWDPDVKEHTINNMLSKANITIDNKKNFKYVFQKNNDNPLSDKGIENLYNRQEIKKRLPKCRNNGNIIKNYLADNINQITDKEVFKNFLPFVKEVEKILE